MENQESDGASVNAFRSTSAKWLKRSAMESKTRSPFPSKIMTFGKDKLLLLNIFHNLSVGVIGESRISDKGKRGT